MRFPFRLLFAFAIGLAIPAAAQGPAAAYWCDPARGYYPQVASCPVPWRTLNSPAPSLPARQPAYVPYPTQYAPYDNYNHGSGP
ncbi:MAG TPA: hypothetical protein VHU15_11620 [Stellaceae bacterium]|jgi:hypothetical protein|nr:hypothetical protein [Stellaceae bacterium]